MNTVLNVVRRAWTGLRLKVVATNKRGVYNVRGSLWQQRTLEYGDFLRVMEITRGKWEEGTDSEKAFGAMFDRWIKEGIIEKLGEVILSPYEPTRFTAWRNRRAIARHGITRENVVRMMDIDELARCVRDFFFLHSRFLKELNLYEAIWASLLKFIRMTLSLTREVPEKSSMPTPEGTSK